MGDWAREAEELRPDAGRVNGVAVAGDAGVRGADVTAHAPDRRWFRRLARVLGSPPFWPPRTGGSPEVRRSFHPHLSAVHSGRRHDVDGVSALVWAEPLRLDRHVERLIGTDRPALIDVIGYVDEPGQRKREVGSSH